MHLRQTPSGVHPFHAFVRPRHLEVPAADPLHELRSGPFHSVGILRGSHLAVRAQRYGYIQQDIEIGPNPPCSQTIRHAYVVEGQPATVPLIGERREVMAIPDHDVAASECRPHHVLDELRASRKHQQKFGLRRELDVGRHPEMPAYRFPDRRTPGLPNGGYGFAS